MKNTKFLVIDGLVVAKNENIVTSLKYDYISDFCNGLALVIKETTSGYKYGYINEKGKVIIPLIYNNAYNFDRYGLAIVNKDVPWGWGCINKKGKVVIPFEYRNPIACKEARKKLHKSEFGFYFDKDIKEPIINDVEDNKKIKTKKKIKI